MRPPTGEGVAFGLFVLALAFMEAEGVGGGLLWLVAVLWIVLRFL